MSKPKDLIGVLEKEAEDNLGQIDAFIVMFQSAQEDAEDLNDKATVEISRLTVVQKKCKRVTSFTQRLLKINEEDAEQKTKATK